MFNFKRIVPGNGLFILNDTTGEVVFPPQNGQGNQNEQ
jgi:hypothetical protein